MTQPAPDQTAPHLAPNAYPVVLVADSLGALQDKLEHAGYAVRSHPDIESCLASGATEAPAAVIIDLDGAGVLPDATLVERIARAHASPPLVFLISSHHDMATRLAAVRSGATRHFIRPFSNDHLIEALDGLTGRREHVPYRILIIDDDRALSAFYSAILQQTGIVTRIVNNPLDTVQAMDEFAPELILLDLYMPHCGGEEVALVIRQDEHWSQIPIIFLSAEGERRKQLSALNTGADEFLTKPIDPDTLTDTVLVKLRRARWINRMNRELQHTLSESEYQRKAMNEHNIVSVADADGNIAFANDKFCEVSGYSSAELIGQNHRIVNSGLHPREFFANLWDTITSGRVWRGIVRNRRKTGEFYWADTTIVPFLDEDGKPYQYVAIRTDITALKTAQEQAENANRAKSQFLSSMSHELRTPMNAILGFAQLLEIQPLSEEDRGYAQEIGRAGRHLLDLINEVLDLARIESGRIDLSIESIDLHEVSAECASLVATLAHKHGLSFDCADASFDGLHVSADRIRLKQVLLNLLSNAVKYNRKGGEVRFAARREGESVRIEISDTGPGIPQSRQSQLFQPFSRLGAEQTQIEGTGIGLVITRNLAELMGGSIGFRSVEGEGSSFWVDLPLTEARPVSGRREAPATAQGLAPTRSAEPHSGRIVLYVEDNPANLKLVAHLIARRPGLRLITAHEPLLGLELARANRPDLILLDINMPVLDGYEVLKRLRADAEMRGTPVIAVSAAAMPADIEKGRTAGFAAYLTKPINIAEFYRILDAELEKSAD